MQYFIKRGEKVQGPFDRQTLMDFWKTGKIVATDLISSNQNGPYQPLGNKIKSITNFQVSNTGDQVSPIPSHLSSDPQMVQPPPLNEGYQKPEAIHRTEEMQTISPVQQKLTQSPDMSFRDRTSNFISDVKSNFKGSDTIPKIIEEIVGEKTEFRFASRPSKMWFYLNLAGRVIIPFMLIEMSVFIALMNINEPVFLPFLIQAVFFGAVFFIAGYCWYVMWINTFFGITDRFIIVRRGFLNRYISVAEARNVQVININSGIIDRWLGMNTVVFQTSASSGVNPFAAFVSSGLVFSNVYLEQVLEAYRAAKGKD